MAIRPNGKRFNSESKPLWDFLLGLDRFSADEGDDDTDRRRLAAFDSALGLAADFSSLEADVAESVLAVAEGLDSRAVHGLRVRMRALSDLHRMILLKSACNWVHARYVRGYENSQRQTALWLKEKSDWEKRHDSLTEDVRNQFNALFAELGVKIRSPRVCEWSRLQADRNDCLYAGQRVNGRAHGPLCAAYAGFIAKSPQAKKYFVENARIYIKARSKGKTPGDAMKTVFQNAPNSRQWFPQAWKDYLAALNLTEQTLLVSYSGVLPHCTDWNADCTWNPHTDVCARYRERLQDWPGETRALEPLYREWRREGFWRSPRKPVFAYPSSRTLPMPKIFGAGFHSIDFARSILRLRLDDMAQGEYLEFSFKPWPSDYDPQPSQTEVTSVHVSFVGTRARVGLRFKVGHRPSRFSITQDDLDTLRRVHFPRASLDASFLGAARESLKKSFQGNFDSDVRIMAVDLGSNSAAVSFFKGREFVHHQPLKIAKVSALSDRWSEGKATGARGLGLSLDHVKRHLERRRELAAALASRRSQAEGAPMAAHDERRLTHHVRWMIRDWVRLNASQIIAAAVRENVDLILFESLRGFAPPGYDRTDDDKKRRLAFFAYGRIRRKVAEKAVERGMLVLTLPYRDSSQICALCGRKQANHGLWKKNKRKKMFVCEYYCGAEATNSDQNAARVLARVFWGEISLPSK
jgi:hypothetical protein